MDYITSVHCIPGNDLDNFIDGRVILYSLNVNLKNNKNRKKIDLICDIAVVKAIWMVVLKSFA